VINIRLEKIVQKLLPERIRMQMGGILDNKIFPKIPPLLQFFLQYRGFKGRVIKDGLVYVEYLGEKAYVHYSNMGDIEEIVGDLVYERVFSIKPGDIVIDVGSHVGIFTIKAAKAVGPKGLVVSIEPEPKNLSLLLKNIKLHHLNNVIVVRKAAWFKKGNIKLYLASSPGSHSILTPTGRWIHVDCDTLDQICLEIGLKKVDFIKIDVEGAELEVLKGAERLLAQPGIKLAIASYHRLPNGKPEFQNILNWLKAKGMETYVRYGNSGEPFIHARTL